MLVAAAASATTPNGRTKSELLVSDSGGEDSDLADLIEDQDGAANPRMAPTEGSSVKRRNMALRKKLPTPSPSVKNGPDSSGGGQIYHNSTSSSLDDSVYSSISNNNTEMYTRYGQWSCQSLNYFIRTFLQ